MIEEMEYKRNRQNDGLLGLDSDVEAVLRAAQEAGLLADLKKK